jgi:predicted nucleic acid-binding Zn ribbon protein
MPADKRGGDPQRIGDALSAFIGLWGELVGPEIAAVTRAISIGEDGTLFAVARTSSWMNELTMMESELLTTINRVTGSKPIRRIRWSIMR